MNFNEEESRMIIEHIFTHGDPWVFEAHNEIIEERKRRSRKGGYYHQEVKNCEKRLIANALKDNNNSRINAAKQLGLHRTTLVEKIKRLKMEQYYAE